LSVTVSGRLLRVEAPEVLPERPSGGVLSFLKFGRLLGLFSQTT
jgi:hypothetical protein